MSIDFGQVRFTRAAPAYVPPPPATPTVGAPPTDPVRDAIVDLVDVGIPAAPPTGVLADIAAAAARARELAEANRELHFHADDESGRIIVEVRDFDGNVIRTIPPSRAIDVMAGLYGTDDS